MKLDQTRSKQDVKLICRDWSCAYYCSQLKNGSPHLHVLRLPMHTPSNVEFCLAKEGSGIPASNASCARQQSTHQQPVADPLPFNAHTKNIAPKPPSARMPSPHSKVNIKPHVTWAFFQFAGSCCSWWYRWYSRMLFMESYTASWL